MSEGVWKDLTSPVRIPGIRISGDRLSAYGGRAFCFVGPSAWNALPDFLKNDTLSLSTFRCQLKHFYFTLLAHRACSRLFYSQRAIQVAYLQWRNQLIWFYLENGRENCVRVVCDIVVVFMCLCSCLGCFVSTTTRIRC